MNEPVEEINLPEQVLDHIDGYITSAVLTAALEHGLFWQLRARPMSFEAISDWLEMPKGRCRYWLQYLCWLGYLTHETGLYTLTEKTRKAIIDAYSQSTWGLLAQEAREQFAPFQYFSSHLKDPGSLWRYTGEQPPDYIERMLEDPQRARRFTYMLNELHASFARYAAGVLEMKGASRLMDLGGGSGVMAIELLKANPGLSAVIVDIPTVCATGAEIIAAAGLADRVRFMALDFVEDELPTDFDIVLECDVGVYGEDLFHKVRSSLTSGGRFIILDQFAPSTDLAPQARLAWSLQGSLDQPEHRYKTAAEIALIMERSGFSDVTIETFPFEGAQVRRFTDDMYRIQGRA